METLPDVLVSRVMEYAPSGIYKLDNMDFHDDEHSFSMDLGESSEQFIDPSDAQG